MIREVALTFYGPSKSNRKLAEKTFLSILDHFMQEKGVYDYKVLSLEHKGQRPTTIIGVYLHDGIAKIEFKEEVLSKNERESD